MKYALLYIVLLCLPQVCRSDEELFWREGGEPIRDKADMKMEKNFGAWLDVTDDEKFFQDWLKPTERFQHPKLNRNKRPLTVYVLVFFAGAGADKNGRCDVTFDSAIKGPNGKVFGQRKNIDCWKGLPAPPPRIIQLSKSYCPLKIEERHPAGRYTLEAKVRDRVKNVELSLVHQFDIE